MHHVRYSIFISSLKKNGSMCARFPFNSQWNDSIYHLNKSVFEVKATCLVMYVKYIWFCTCSIHRSKHCGSIIVIIATLFPIFWKKKHKNHHISIKATCNLLY